MMELRPSFIECVISTPDGGELNRTVEPIFTRLIDEVTSRNSAQYFAVGEGSYFEYQKVYCLVQCTPDISRVQCKECLMNALNYTLQCANSSSGLGSYHNGPSCQTRYGVFPFFDLSSSSRHPVQPTASPPISPQLRTSNIGGTKEFIVRKDYICDDTKGTYTSNGTFSSNLKLAFSNLTTLSSSRIFSNITIGSDAADNVYALYDCRNDISLDLCHRCIEDAIKSILDLCNDQPKEAIVFYEECMLRYANRMIFSTMELTPNYTNCDLVYYTNRDIKEAIKSTLKSLVDEATKESKSSSYYFASKPMIRIVDRYFYFLVQCTPDLSRVQCKECLTNALNFTVESCASDHRLGGHITGPSCEMRYEDKLFFNVSSSNHNYTPRPVKTMSTLTMILLIETEEFSRLNFECDYDKGTYSSNSTFRVNLELAFSNLTALSSSRMFSNVTVGSDADEANKVYALFDCRNDISLDKCHRCIKFAVNNTLDLDRCIYQPKDGVAMYEECTLHYANRMTFSTMELTPNYTYCDSFMFINRPIKMDIKSNLKSLIDEATMNSSSSSNFAIKYVNYTVEEDFYFLVQCTPDLSRVQCKECLTDALNYTVELCGSEDRLGGRIEGPSCKMRYSVDPFFNVSSSVLISTYVTPPPDDHDNLSSDLSPMSSTPVLPPPSTPSEGGRRPSIFCLYCVSSITQATEEEFVRNDWECDDTKGTYTSNGTFSLNLKLAFSNLTALSSSRIFSNVTVGSDDDEANKVYALYDCRNDIPLDKCHRCIEDAIESILDLCNDQPKEAIVIYEECMLRYANRTIFSAMELTPNYTSCALEYYTNRMIKVAIKSNLETLMSKATKEGSSLLSNFATKYVSDIVGDRFFYFLVQCTPDLSKVECKECLTDALNFTVDSCASYNRLGGQIKGPSCQMRYDVKRFFNVSSSDYSSTPMSSKSKAKLSFLIVIICVVFVFALLVKIICRRKS
uniref:Gnk2-homologous domain-containing protein n=1 Tax=Chenopodium quinoa TaxID=63459 RepID=A0A803LBF3_CHEQI